MLEGLREVFDGYYKQLPKKFQDVYVIKDSGKKREDYQSIVPIGMLDEKNESEAITYADMAEGYSKSFSHTAWAKGLRFSRELLDDELYDIMSDKTKHLARAAWYRKEYQHALLFNNAAATTYFTGQDALALASTAHTLAGTPGTTFSNYSASTDLSVTSLDTAFNAIRRFVDDKNLLINLEPAVLLIPPEMERVAFEVLKSSGAPYTADNQVNYYEGKLRVMTWKFLTDTDSWFILVPKDELAPISFNRVETEFDKDGDFDTMDKKVMAYTRFSNGFLDPRFAYCGNI